MWIPLCVLHLHWACNVISCDAKGCSVPSLIVTIINSCIVRWWYTVHAKLFLLFFFQEKLFFFAVEQDCRVLISGKYKYFFQVLLCLILFLIWFCLFCPNQITDWACLIFCLLHSVLAPRTSTCQPYHHIASAHQHTLAYQTLQWQPVLTSLTPQKMGWSSIPDLQMKWTTGHYMRHLSLLNFQKMNLPMIKPSAPPLKKIQQELTPPNLKTVLPHAAGKRSVKVQIIPNWSHKLCSL